MLTINNTIDGYLKDVEILGNTIQSASNLADIRSVGDKVEGQELYEIPVVSDNGGSIQQIKGYSNYSDGYYSKTRADKLNGFTILENAPMGQYTLRFTMKKDYVGTQVCKIYETKNNEIINEINLNILVPGGAFEGEFESTFTTSNEGSVLILGLNTSNALSFSLKDDVNLSLGEKINESEEDKLTILSPTPLEKVGDVADRIVEKNGVWGVEKSIAPRHMFKNLKCASKASNDTHITFEFERPANIKKSNGNCFATGLKGDGSIWGAYTKEGIRVWDRLMFCLERHKINAFTDDELEKYLNSIDVYAILETPTFIPFPHDQQVKLRTFANKTNISFLTEIEGTIKAQVPKSLGATVNTHTEQINNLNKELDRVKKLEESTVSTVETGSDFTTVEATSNGYFEDVKLEGKTLVNLYKNEAKTYHADYIFSPNEGVNLDLFIPGNTYTAIVHNSTTNFDTFRISSGDVTYDLVPLSKNAIVKFIYTPPTNDAVKNNIRCYCYPNVNKFVSGDENKISITILEGDHTQNPPSYFEGLKSVGDGADEIVVSSCNNIKEFKHNKVTSSLVYDFDITDIVDNNFDLFNPFSYKLKVIINDAVTNKWKRDIINLGYGVHNIKLNDGEKVIKVRGVLTDGWHSVNSEDFFNKICFSYNFKQDKKRLLYYNEETQAWEKPILREWDSIEKHANGKYYYHQRSGEIVLNGSENWINPSWTENDTIAFSYSLQVKPNGEIAICDKFNVVSNGLSTQTVECCQIVSNTSIGIRVFKSKLPTQDVQGFKQWLQANNVTVVYQLAQEKVYECTNIDLITYNGETNYIVESGAIVPRSTLKVHNNISNVVSLLQKKVSILDDKVTGILINAQSVEDETSIVGNKLNLTTDKYQVTNMVNNTQIVLPTVDKFTEIHLFFDATSDMTLVYPSVKWQTQPTIKANASYEFIFTYVNDAWLGGYIVRK